MDDPKVAFIGVGLMGEGMAARLLSRGCPVGVIAHRSREPIDRLVARGATEHDDLAAMVGASDVVVTCLPTADDLVEVTRAAAASVAPGLLWIDASTGHPDSTRTVAATLAEKGARFADAPVTGGPPQAERGELASLVGCEEADLEAVETVVGAYSTVIRHMGPIGSGHTAKLLNNFVTQGTMVLLGLAFRMARRQGVDWQALYDAMSAGAGRSGTLEKSVAPALGGDFDGSRFTIANAEKDLRYAADLFSGNRDAVARALHGELRDYVDGGQGDLFVSRQLTGPPDDRR